MDAATHDKIVISLYKQVFTNIELIPDLFSVRLKFTIRKFWLQYPQQLPSDSLRSCTPAQLCFIKKMDVI